MSGNDKKSVNPLFTGGAQGAPFSIQQSFGGPAVMPLGITYVYTWGVFIKGYLLKQYLLEVGNKALFCSSESIFSSVCNTISIKLRTIIICDVQ